MPRTAWALLLLGAPLMAAGTLPFDVSALLKIVRVSDPQVSPDGKMVAYTAQTMDFAENTKPSQIWVAPPGGGAPKQLTHEGTENARPRWLPDSKSMVFVSNRSGDDQIWTMNADGSAARQLTRLATGASGVTVSGDGKKLAFTSAVYPECADDGCNKARMEAEKNGKVKARVYTELLYRHWTEWKGARRSHVFAMNVDGTGVKDMTPGTRDVPPFSLGGMDGYSISPDGGELCYVMNADAAPATSTSSDLYVVALPGAIPPASGAAAARRGGGEEDQHQRGRGRGAGVFAGREVDRVSEPGAGRV